MEQLIECVPNFSEGKNIPIIKKITAEIERIEGVQLLNVDIGKDANRTVMTFVGKPETVAEAAFQAIKKAGELIDMRIQKGEHPRMGATDVCPLIPIKNISLQETAGIANALAKRVGEELQIPVYLYEASQKNKKRSNLSIIRKGEYEGFFSKINLPNWQPDFGPTEMDVKRGCTVIGARNFLLAFNINLNTKNIEIANAIAAEVRESGKIIVENGNKKRMAGKLKNVKAIGWFMEEYDKAQVSMNLTNMAETPAHIVFEEICKLAEAQGVQVTGSELIGMIPLQAMLDAGIYFNKKQSTQNNFSEKELIEIAIKKMGLNELAPFNPNEKIIEYAMQFT